MAPAKQSLFWIESRQWPTKNKNKPLKENNPELAYSSKVKSENESHSQNKINWYQLPDVGTIKICIVAVAMILIEKTKYKKIGNPSREMETVKRTKMEIL